jgi:hypothetical protein
MLSNNPVPPFLSPFPTASNPCYGHRGSLFVRLNESAVNEEEQPGTVHRDSVIRSRE